MASENKKSFSRRKFLQRGAIVLGGTVFATYMGRGALRRVAAQKVEDMDFPALISSFQPDFWFQVLADNTILLKSPKSEIGQGIFIGFAMMAAEELEVPLEQIKVEHANTSSGVVDNMGTGGSNSTNALFRPIREVAATMREMLKIAAAKQWGVKTEEVIAQNGTLTSGKKSITYAQIAALTKAWDIPETPELKPQSAFKYIGKEHKRYDLKPKVMATAKYTIDSELPDMLHAMTLESPYFEGKIKSIDTSKAEKSANVVKVVKEGELVAVVAKTRYAAEMALQKIEVVWDVPKKWQQADIDLMMTVGKTTPTGVQNEGDAVSMIQDNAAKVFKQEYRIPIATHATMEVYGAIADVQNEKTTIITGSQYPDFVRMQVAKDLGIDKEKVDVVMPYIGGGFGRRTPRNYASKAALISKIVGKPIKIIPSREQEFQCALYRPNTHHLLQAVIGDNGTVEAIMHDQATPQMVVRSLGGDTALNLLGADWLAAGHGVSILYNIKNKAANVWNVDVPYPASIWRGVGMYPNTFAIESFIDELAAKTKKDPLALRLELLNGSNEVAERMAKALKVLGEKSAWNSPKAANIGRGIAVCSDRKTIAASMIEVEIVEGKIKVKKVVSVIDVGFAINPEGIRAQMEGAAMMGISAGLFEEILIKDGQLMATNYHEYPVAMLKDTPEIQTIILENASETYGVGEPPIAPIAPAIANAVFSLTGKRLRNLPLQKSLDNYSEKA